MSHDEVVGHDAVPESVFATRDLESLGQILVPIPAKRPVLSVSAEDWQRWMVEKGYPAYRHGSCLIG